MVKQIFGAMLSPSCTNFALRKAAAINQIPESEQAVSVVNLDINDLPTECTTGLKRDVENDEFVWEVQKKVMVLSNQKVVSRRSILSIVCSLFDPLGFISPYVMKAKLLLQELCRKRLDWDEIIGKTEERQWS